MKQKYNVKRWISLLIAFFVAVGFSVDAQAQTVVFTDDFNTSQGTTFTTTGAIGTSDWTITRSGADWGGRIHNDILELTNTASAAANANGWVFAHIDADDFESGFNPILEDNTDLVVWYFNMQQIRPNPAGFSSNAYGAGYILATDNTSVASAGSGYAVVLGNTGTPDPVRLVKFTGGIQTLGTVTGGLITAGAPLNNPTTSHMSIRVTYNPETNEWRMYGRTDGASFADPKSGSLTLVGTATDDEYVDIALPFSGGYWQGSTAANQTALFDNVTVQIGATPAAGMDAPTFSVAPGIYFADQTVFVSNFGDYTGSTVIYYTLDGTTPDNTSLVYNNATGVLLQDGDGPIVLSAIAIDGAEESGVTIATYTFPVNIADIAAFRAGTDGVLYRIGSEVTVLARNSFRNRHFVRDGSGSLTIWDEASNITTDYAIGDNFSGLIGTRSVNNNGAIITLNAATDPGAASSSGNDTTPVTITVEDLTLDFTGNLVRIVGAEFTSFGTGNFVNGTNYSLTDPSTVDNITFRTDFFNADYIGEEVPTVPFNLTGVVFGFAADVQIVARDLDDFELPNTFTQSIGGSAGWRALSLPVGNVPVSVLAAQNQIQGVSGVDAIYGTTNFDDADPNFLIWANTAADQFVAPASVATQIESGQGFGWYFFNNNDTPFSNALPFDLEVTGFVPTTDITRTLNTENDFTFLGNPFNEAISTFQVVGTNGGDIAITFLVYDPITGNFVDDSGTIDVFTGFFVEKLADGDVNIAADDPVILSQPQFAEVRFNLVGMDGDLEVVDNATRLLFHENATFEFDRYDLSKLRSLHYQFANISFIGEKFGNPVNKMIDSYPLALDDAIEVMMSLDVVNFSGEFTLSADMVDVPEGWTITLTDNLTGETVNLRNQVYTFFHEGEVSTASALDFSQVGALQTNDPEGRFTVVVNPVTTSAPVNNELPTVLALNQNYPNPFNPTTQISYDLPETAEVRLDVFNIQGQRVATLVNTTQNAGTHRINFDGANLSSGVYIYRLTAGANVLTKKMTLIK